MESTSYEDFEPLCKWKREQNKDTLEVHLPGFKRQQLKVQVSSSGMLIITGERHLDESKTTRSRFRKEFPVSKDYQTNQFHAKFSNDILYLTMPKQISTASGAGASARNNIVSSRSFPSSRIALQIIVAISLAVAIGAYVKKYCQCSHIGN